MIRLLIITSLNGTKKIWRKANCTDYYFNCSLEIFGNGVYCDWLTITVAIAVTFQSNSINNGIAYPYYHPDITDNSVLNTQPINIMSVEDCFWIISANQVSFSADVYIHEIKETA